VLRDFVLLGSLESFFGGGWVLAFRSLVRGLGWMRASDVGIEVGLVGFGFVSFVCGGIG
jgi:hypothetical protein